MNFLYLTGTAYVNGDLGWQDALLNATKKSKHAVKAYISYYDQLVYNISNGKTEVYDTYNNCLIDQYDVVHFRNYARDGRASEAFIVADLFNQRDKKVLPSEIETQYDSSNKLWQMHTLTAAGVNVPQTYFIRTSNSRAGLNYLAKNNHIAYPCIIKSVSGMKGSDNYLIHNYDELIAVYDANPSLQFILQPYIPNDGDYRVLFFGSDNDPIVFKRTAKSDTHLNNSSKGGATVDVQIDELDKAHLDMCRRALSCMNVEIAGVDLIINSSDGVAYILEVNTTPALLTGHNVAQKAAHYISYVEGLYYKGSI